MTPETQIQADVETLRQQFTDTQDLYREVSALLFFRYGVTPTANKLYQYVRKGSMSAPAEALARFWNDLREKSRGRIEHPDLPEELKSAAGDLVATLWTQARAAAQEGFGAFRADAQRAVEKAQAAQSLAEGELHAAAVALDQSREAQANLGKRTLILERELAATRAATDFLESQVTGVQRQREALEAALVEARRDFGVDLAKLRDALKLSEERFEAVEKRALREIDRERTTASKAQTELTELRESQARAHQGHREEIGQLQALLGDARQKLGAAEGSIQELRNLLAGQVAEMQTLRGTVAASEAQSVLLRNELSVANARVADLLKQTQQGTTEKVAAPRRRRKTLKTG